MNPFFFIIEQLYHLTLGVRWFLCRCEHFIYCQFSFIFYFYFVSTRVQSAVSFYPHILCTMDSVFFFSLQFLFSKKTICHLTNSFHAIRMRLFLQIHKNIDLKCWYAHLVRPYRSFEFISLYSLILFVVIWEIWFY